MAAIRRGRRFTWLPKDAAQPGERLLRATRHCVAQDPSRLVDTVEWLSMASLS